MPSFDADTFLTQYRHGEVDFAMTYGSGAMPQTVSSHRRRMIDIVLAVRDPYRWHKQNLEKHARDYSFVRHLGADAVTRLQECGPGITYNTNVPFGDNGQSIKYGVISTRALIKDLQEWRHLFVAGRMHKPHNVIQEGSADIAVAQSKNLVSALAASRLLLPAQFTMQTLLETITGLSYEGDIRKAFGAEHPRKITAIVDGARVAFERLYHDAITSSAGLTVDGELCTQDTSPSERSKLVDFLPLILRQDLACLCEDPNNLQKNLRRRLKAIVLRSSMTMLIKGICSAGPLRAIRYAAAKLHKGWAAANG